MFLKDQKTKGIQYSKFLVLLCVLLAVSGIGIVIWASINFLMTETLACAIVAMCGSLAITSVVWMLKKSQAENTVKIYISAYEHIMNINSSKQNADEDNFILQQQMKDKVLSELDGIMDTAISDSTSPIERHDINI